MIAGRDLAKSLSRVIKRCRDFDGGDGSARKIPTTMRELVEGDFDGGPDTRCNTWSIDLTRCRPVKNRSPIPVFCGRAERPRPAESPAIGCTRFYVICAAFYKWCIKHKHKIDIDYPLSEPWLNWPIWKAIDSTLKKRSGLGIEEIFWQFQWEDEETEWDYCYMPLYSLTNGGDEEPIVEFLDNIWGVKYGGGFVLPEELRHIDGLQPQEVDTAEEVFQNIVKHKRFKLMPKLWRKALEALDKYEGSSICVWDPEEGKVGLDPTAESMENIFGCAETVGKMLCGTQALVGTFCRDDLAFWRGFVEHLNKTAKRHPELVKKIHRKGHRERGEKPGLCQQLAAESEAEAER